MNMRQVTTIRRGGKPRPVSADRPPPTATTVSRTPEIVKPMTVVIAPPRIIDSTAPETKAVSEKESDKHFMDTSKALSLTQNVRRMSIPMGRSGQRRVVPCRPSLSEQLASIGAKAAELTLEIKQTHGLVDKINMNGKPLHCFPANSFCVGSLHCRYPSPVSFYQDRCEYIFNHPHDRLEIRMVMYYAHMARICYSATKMRRKLEHFKDFDPNNANHPVSIELPSSAISAIKCLITLKSLEEAIFEKK